MNQRYSRNMTTLSSQENEALGGFRVAVIGCGGLGGYIIEHLGRLGIGTIVCVDGDVFEETNLNRQILSAEANLGTSKALAAKERMHRVNSTIKVIPVSGNLDAGNGAEILQGCHLVFDALDNAPSRRVLQELCETLGIPMVHGAIGGWYGQVSVIFPGDRSLDRILPPGMEKGIETELGNPSFTPGVIASIQVAEGIKVLLGRLETLRGKLLVVDLLNQEYEVLDI